MDQATEEAQEEKDEERIGRVEFIKQVHGRLKILFDEIDPLLRDGKDRQANKTVNKFLKGFKKDMKGLSDSNKLVRLAKKEIEELIELHELLIEQDEKPSIALEVVSTGMDIVPFLGGSKMMLEAMRGSTLTGKDLSVFKRLWRFNEGIFWLLLDTGSAFLVPTSAGTGSLALQALKAGKGLRFLKAIFKARKALKVAKSSKALQRTGALMRMRKIKGSKSVFRFGRFLGRRPKLDAKLTGRLFKNSRLKLFSKIWKIPGTIKDTLGKKGAKRGMIESIIEQTREMDGAIETALA